MAWIYSALDCLLAVSMGEGFCNPLVEAACCGTTAITSGWTAPADLCPHGWTIPVDCAEPYWLEYMQAYHYVPHISAIIDTLEQAYQEGWTGLAERGSRAASWGREHFDMETVFMKHWIPILAELERRIRDDAEREQIQVLSGDKTREEEASA
jgi:glycosyltransferase involved in cell wall biosynthesis